MARENGRMIRDQLSEEIWVELNNLYLFLNSPTLLQQFAQDPDNFFRRVIRFSLVFKAFRIPQFTKMKGGDLCHWVNISRGQIKQAEYLIHLLFWREIRPAWI